MLFLLLILVNIAMRYPRTLHEVGIDGYYIHGMASAIYRDGYAGWILHPYSYAGLYPFSYPSSFSFMLASTSALMDINVEASILFVDIFLSLFSAAAFYMLMKELRDDEILAFMGAFIYSTSPLFLRFTLWHASTRLMFVVLFPMLLYVLLRCHSSSAKKYILFLIPMSFVLMCTHRVALSFFAALLVYLVANILYIIINRAKKASTRYKTFHIIMRWSSPFILFGIFLLIILVQFGAISESVDIDIEQQYGSGVVSDASDTPGILVNLFISLMGRVGIWLVFAFIGFFTLMWKENKGVNDWFFVLGLLAFFPFVSIRTYGSIVLLLYTSIFIALGIRSVLRATSKNKAITFALAMVIMFGSIAFTEYMNTRLISGPESEQAMSREELAAYLNIGYVAEAPMISSGGQLFRVSAISGQPDIFMGDSLLLHSKWIKEEDIIVEPLDISELTLESDYLFRVTSSSEVPRYNPIMYEGLETDTSMRIINKYEIEYAVGTNPYPVQFMAFGNWYYSRFLSSVSASRYATFSNEVLSVYFLTDHQ